MYCELCISIGQNGDVMGKIHIKIWGGENNIRIYNNNKAEIGLATDREDYHDELNKLVWSLDNKGYIKNKEVGSLHKYMMQKWYGDDVVDKFYQKGFIIDHINNKHNDNRISNLAFYSKTRNVAKGMYFDRESEQIGDELRLTIHKDFQKKCYQISIAFNDCFFTLREPDVLVQIYALYLFYNSDISYDTVVNDATDIITMFQENDEIDLSNLKYCDYKLYDENSDSIFDIKFTEHNTEDDQTLCIPMDDCIFRVVPQEENWEPTKGKNRLSCELIIRNKPCQKSN